MLPDRHAYGVRFLFIAIPRPGEIGDVVGRLRRRVRGNAHPFELMGDFGGAFRQRGRSDPPAPGRPRCRLGTASPAALASGKTKPRFRASQATWTSNIRSRVSPAFVMKPNRAWCFVNGDVSQVEWAEAPAWQRESALRGVEFALANPDVPDSALHDAWSADKVRDGWQYGPVKDAQAKTHPCLVPFDQLPAHQQAKDRLFRAIVRALANSNQCRETANLAA